MATCLFLSWAYWKTKGVEVRYGRHSTSRTRGGPQGPPCEKFGWCEYALTGPVVRVCTSANRTRALAIPEPVDAASVFATSITKAMKSQRFLLGMPHEGQMGIAKKCPCASAFLQLAAQLQAEKFPTGYRPPAIALGVD